MSDSTFVNPWHPDAIPPITPDHRHLVNPTGELGPQSYIDTGAYWPAKYPTIKVPKRKNAKNQDGDGKKKTKKPNLKLDLNKKEEGRTQTTLDRWLLKPRTPARVRFKERVLFEEYTRRTESWTIIPLKGFSEPHSAFAIQRLEVKRRMAREHYWKRQRPTPKNVRKVTHILKTMQRENAKLGY